MKKMLIEATGSNEPTRPPIVKKTFTYQQVDHVQNVALVGICSLKAYNHRICYNRKPAEPSRIKPNPVEPSVYQRE